MSFIIGLLTVVLFLNGVLLVFLVLIQLPKKEAGIGVAFGSGATDALFGAGSGNALTKVTRHATIVFLVLALVLSILVTRHYGSSDTSFGAKVDSAATATPTATSPGAGLPSPDVSAALGLPTNAAPKVVATNPPITVPAEKPTVPTGTNQ